MSLLEGEKFLHQFTENEFYIYLVCDLVNQYARGEIRISDMVDYWQFYKVYKDRLDWEYVEKELESARISDFAHRLQDLAFIWFGDQHERYAKEYDEEADVYETMELYILTRGAQGREESAKLTELVKEMSDIQSRKRREERVRRFRGFLFPDRRYMEHVFPILEDAPFLMPLCWLWRSLMLALLPPKKKIYRMFRPIKRKIRDTVDEMAARREEKLMERMDEAVRQVMEESSSLVGQEIHDILDLEEEPGEEVHAEEETGEEENGDLGKTEEEKPEVYGMRDFFSNL